MKLGNCTFLIKTFLRPDCLSRVLFSIHRYYPGTPTIVVDDSGNDEASTICSAYRPWVRLLQTDKTDVGISAGRNLGLAEINTEFFVLLDDDCMIWIMTDIALMLRRLIETGADVVCGPFCELDKGLIRQSAMEFLEHENRYLLVKSDLPLGNEGWVKASNNFFAARTAIQNKVTWPERLKVSEHAPYFWLLFRAGGKVWASHFSSVVHLRVDDPVYETYRFRVDERSDEESVLACDEFSKEHGFIWQMQELIEEFGESANGHEFGWPRYLSPNCDTHARLMLRGRRISEKLS